METMYYIGLDVHKKTIDYCVKDGGGRIYAAGSIGATRLELDIWMKTLPQLWTAAMEKERPHRCRKIADCLRCDFLPECYMASTEIRHHSKPAPRLCPTRPIK
jgi:transposase